MPEYDIPRLVKMVKNGEIGIPELQREFVWSDNRVCELAESIYKNYPIGLITLYRVPSELRSNQERYWVLDGQQRLLSLSLIMEGEIEAMRRGRQEVIRRDIWFDPKNERFELRAPRKGENWIKLSELLQIQGRAELESLLRKENFDFQEQERISTLWATFRRDYKVLVHELPEDFELDDLGNIFVRTNFSGTRVKGADVYSTIIAVRYGGLVRELRGFCAKLPIEIDYGVLIRTFIAFITGGKVKLASRVLEQADKLSSVLEKRKENMEYLLEKVKENVSQTMSLLEEMGIDGLPTENVVPVMAYYFYKRSPLPDMERKGLFKWFILASFFGRYSSSVETKLDEDLSTIERGGSYKDLIKNIEYIEGNLKERIKEFIDRGEGGSLLLYALLRESNAKDFLPPHEPITRGNSVVHHIFPLSHLIGSRYEQLSSDIGNLTLITSQSNQRLSNKLPENYLPEVPSEILKSHYIPEDRECWKLGKIEEFIEQRKKLLKDAVESFFRDICKS
ncbi:MAG: DUF262 domain-containing protein [Candidatus Methanomethylicia archaeon]